MNALGEILPGSDGSNWSSSPDFDQTREGLVRKLPELYGTPSGSWPLGKESL